MADGGDVLGNLPRSRPGTRSAKRTGGGAKRTGGGAKDARTKRAASSAGKRPATGSRGKPAAARGQRAGGRGAKPEPPMPGADPVGDAFRVAGKAAEAGLRVASGVTREVLRRLPRP
jgi:hypothetical protein